MLTLRSEDKDEIERTIGSIVRTQSSGADLMLITDRQRKHPAECIKRDGQTFFRVRGYGGWLEYLMVDSNG